MSSAIPPMAQTPSELEAAKALRKPGRAAANHGPTAGPGGRLDAQRQEYAEEPKECGKAETDR